MDEWRLPLLSRVLVGLGIRSVRLSLELALVSSPRRTWPSVFPPLLPRWLALALVPRGLRRPWLLVCPSSDFASMAGARFLCRPRRHHFPCFTF